MSRTCPTLRVDLGALTRNYQAMQTLAAGAEVGASVKANAYGLGVGGVVPALRDAGCRSFFVATPEEGMDVRGLAPGSDVYVLNGVGGGEAESVNKAGLIPVLSSSQAVEAWRSHGDGRPCAVMFDTGMNRLGLPIGMASTLAESGLNIIHVMSHLACAEDAGHAMNARQRTAFETVLPLFPTATRSLANSGGAHLGPDFHYDMVRLGIALYGGFGDTEPVASVGATVLQVREVAAGETLGYDATWTAEVPTRVAVVGLGYADGFPVALSNRGFGRWRGERVGVVGRVSMDLTCLNIGEHEVAVGGVVTFLGGDLRETAALAGTIPYELLTRLGYRLHRCGS